MPRTSTRVRSYGYGETPAAMPAGFTLHKSELRSAVGSRMAEGNQYTRRVAASYRMGRPSGLPAFRKTGMGAMGVVPTVEVDMVDEISPTLKSAVAARIMMAKYRAVADKVLAEAWATAIAKEFATGPSRWKPLSRHYMLWKIRKGKGGIANLILSGKIANNVYRNARDAVKVSGSANPNYRIDVAKQFRSTPYVWRHEYGDPSTNLPQRDFINRARKEIALTLSGISVTEFLVVSETMKGAAVQTPRTLHVDGQTTIDRPGTVSWGWLGRWFAHPYWWVVPPSKALLYMGIASDVRSILVRGIQVERMIVPFFGAWGLGTAGAKMGIPLTKKTARRRTRRRLWRGR